MAFLWDMKRTPGFDKFVGNEFRQPHDCMDAGGRVTQEQLPRLPRRGEAQEEPGLLSIYSFI